MSDCDPFSNAALAGRPLREESLLDIHGHCAGLEEPQDGSAPRTWPLSSRALLAAMDRIGAAHLVFSHFDALRATTPSALAAAHRDTEALVAASGGRLSAHLVLHPYFPEEVHGMLDRVAGGDAIHVGAKVHGELHDVRAASPRIAPLLGRCEDLGLSVLLHVHPADSSADIGALAARFPRLTFVLAHLWPRPEGVAALFGDHPNLRTDTSLSYGLPGAIEAMVRAAGPDRVLYGSDCSYLSMGAQFSKAACTALPVADKRRLFSVNALAAFPLLERRLAPAAPSRPLPPPQTS